MQKNVLLGNEAVARGVYEAGCHVATAYPGTPSTEILETIAKDYKNIKTQWSPNEKVALEVAIGASIAGGRAVAIMKHVGMNVAADPLFNVSYTGVNAGLVIINVDDPGAWSSQCEQDNRHFARAAKIPMIEPSSPEEARKFIKIAFEISEKFDTPVIFRITTRIAHSRGIVLFDKKNDVPVKKYDKNPEKYVMLPVNARKRHQFIETQMVKLKKYSNKSELNQIEWADASSSSGSAIKRGIITDSVAYQYVKETCPDDSVLKIGFIWPMPDEMIKTFARAVDELYVVEELDPFIEEHVKALGISVTGKKIIPIHGELTPDIVNQAINNKQFQGLGSEYKSQIPVRPPGLCKNCPHGYVFRVLKKLDLYVHGDIGCYTLGALSPYSAMHTQLCMGASIGMHFGFELVHGDEIVKKSVAVIGDSTFIHSGITPLIDLVYNKGTGTVIILDNQTTAMTGHQDNPSTGRTLIKETTHKLDFEMLVKAVGIQRIKIVDPREMDKFEQVVLEEIKAREPSVIISARKCILKK